MKKLYNNCILDYKSKIKIPQNENKYFLIEKSADWKTSIEVKFDFFEPINQLNLLLIIKSYALNKRYYVHSCAIRVHKKDKKDIITLHNTRIRFIKNMG